MILDDPALRWALGDGTGRAPITRHTIDAMDADERVYWGFSVVLDGAMRNHNIISVDWDFNELLAARIRWRVCASTRRP